MSICYLTRDDIKSIGLLMKRLAGRQIRFVNKLENRTVSLWDGRYKMSIVGSDESCIYTSRQLPKRRRSLVQTYADLTQWQISIWPNPRLQTFSFMHRPWAGKHSRYGLNSDCARCRQERSHSRFDPKITMLLQKGTISCRSCLLAY